MRFHGCDARDQVGTQIVTNRKQPDDGFHNRANGQEAVNVVNFLWEKPVDEGADNNTGKKKS